MRLTRVIKIPGHVIAVALVAATALVTWSGPPDWRVLVLWAICIGSALRAWDRYDKRKT